MPIFANHTEIDNRAMAASNWLAEPKIGQIFVHWPLKAKAPPAPTVMRVAI